MEIRHSQVLTKGGANKGSHDVEWKALPLAFLNWAMSMLILQKPEPCSGRALLWWSTALMEHSSDGYSSDAAQFSWLCADGLLLCWSTVLMEHSSDGAQFSWLCADRLLLFWSTAMMEHISEDYYSDGAQLRWLHLRWTTTLMNQPVHVARCYMG